LRKGKYPFDEIKRKISAYDGERILLSIKGVWLMPCDTSGTKHGSSDSLK
jgi:hypothetical protein